MTIASKEQTEYDNDEREESIEINMNPNEFRIVGFIDDTNIRACRTGSGPINGDGKLSDRRDRTEEGNYLQRSFYR